MKASGLTRTAVYLAAVLAARAAHAIDLDISTQEMEQVLTVSRGTEADRAAFMRRM